MSDANQNSIDPGHQTLKRIRPSFNILLPVSPRIIKNVPANINWKPHGFYLDFLLLVAIGSYLRLDQFTLKVLLDDEWHVIHQFYCGIFSGGRPIAATGYFVQSKLQ